MKEAVGNLFLFNETWCRPVHMTKRLQCLKKHLTWPGKEILNTFFFLTTQALIRLWTKTFSIFQESRSRSHVAHSFLVLSRLGTWNTTIKQRQSRRTIKRSRHNTRWGERSNTDLEYFRSWISNGKTMMGRKAAFSHLTWRFRLDNEPFWYCSMFQTCYP